MQIDLNTTHDLSPQCLAQSLAKATPEDFAKFWLAFSELADDDLLSRFAEAMAPELGGNRKRTLKRLAELITYFEVRSTWERKAAAQIRETQ